MMDRPAFKRSRLAHAIAHQARACLLLAGLLGTEIALAVEAPTEANAAFDLETLKSRGIDPKLAAFFSESSRFLPGRKEVALFVNQDRIGNVVAQFDDEGQLCFDQNLLDKAGLILPLEYTPVEAQTIDVYPAQAPEQDIPAAEALSETGAAAAPAAKPARPGLLRQMLGPISTWSAQPAAELSTLAAQQSGSGTRCYDFKAAYPQTEVDLRPGKQEVHLIVPQEALKPVEKDFSQFSRGGMGGLLNYDVLTMDSQSGELDSSYSSLNTEMGVNIGNWAVRSRQNWIEQDGQRNSEHLYTYAQRTFLPLKSIVQAGQINMASPVFAGASITGLQLLPDSALNENATGGATIEGIANSSQARVEVKQDGILIYNTVVPAGPFVLRNIALLRGNSNVDVTIFETDGSRDSFSLPAASLHRATLSQSGLSMALGTVRDVSDSGADEPEVFTVSNDWLVGSRNKVAAGLMLSPDYLSTGWVLDTVLSKDTSVSVSNVLAQAKKEDGQSVDNQGIQSSVTARTKFTERLSASGSVTHQNDGYRDLIDTTQIDERYPIYQDPTDPTYVYRPKKDDDDEDRFGRTQYSANLGFTTDNFGGGSLGLNQSKSSNDGWNRTLSASWGKSFKGVSVSATVQHDMTGDDGNSAYLSVSLPLGTNRSLQTRVSKSGDNDTQVGATYNETVNDQLNYSLSASQQSSGEGTDLAGNLSALPRYAQVNLGYSQDGADSSSHSFGARGALAFHPEGITPSPYHIQDTFGVVQLGDEAGVKIHTPNGNVWTDGAGRAVVAQIPAYTTSRIEVATDTLPRNVDIDNGYKTLEVARGAVSKLDFGVVKVRRILLTALDQHGKPLPKGASVMGDDETFLTTVVDDGKIFLEDTSYEKVVVNLPGGKQCTLQFELADEADVESYFEFAPAVCPVS
jgi:outer membrane usher protein FimD/PapC